jgi:hypothetical protein
MKRSLLPSKLKFTAFIAAGMIAGSIVVAGQPSEGWWLFPGISLGRPCPCCPDNYCGKPMPIICPVTCFGPNDYCGKPMPCMAPYYGFGCDDYCPKPMPVIAPCYTPPGAICGPPDCSVCPKAAK